VFVNIALHVSPHSVLFMRWLLIRHGISHTPYWLHLLVSTSLLCDPQIRQRSKRVLVGSEWHPQKSEFHDCNFIWLFKFFSTMLWNWTKYYACISVNKHLYTKTCLDVLYHVALCMILHPFCAEMTNFWISIFLSPCLRPTAILLQLFLCSTCGYNKSASKWNAG
jgi:hypothetical protein